MGPMVCLEAFPQHKRKKGKMKNKEGKKLLTIAMNGSM
jgi:hypothetical protein